MFSCSCGPRHDYSDTASGDRLCNPRDESHHNGYSGIAHIYSNCNYLRRGLSLNSSGYSSCRASSCPCRFIACPSPSPCPCPAYLYRHFVLNFDHSCRRTHSPSRISNLLASYSPNHLVFNGLHGLDPGSRRLSSRLAIS